MFSEGHPNSALAWDALRDLYQAIDIDYQDMLLCFDQYIALSGKEVRKRLRKYAANLDT